MIMAAINDVSVTNLNTGANWVCERAEAPDPLPANYDVRVNAGNNQPPAGFLNHPAHQFRVQGRYMATGDPFVSGDATFNGQQSDPPMVAVFTV
jgi:hypothetical protein